MDYLRLSVIVVMSVIDVFGNFIPWLNLSAACLSKCVRPAALSCCDLAPITFAIAITIVVLLSLSLSLLLARVALSVPVGMGCDYAEYRMDRAPHLIKTRALHLFAASELTIINIGALHERNKPFEGC